MGYTLPFSFAQQRTKPNMNPLILLTACVAASQAQIIAAPYGLGAPLTYGAAPIAYQTAAAPAPVVTVNAAPAPAVAAAPLNPSSQFQAQDEFGNIQYGYSNINSQKHETGNTYGGVSGSYSYVDANGVVQTTNYIADGLGFRVQATNPPVAPTAPEVAPLEQPTFNLVGPAPVEDTPEVAAAKAEFQAAFDEAASRAKRSTPASTLPLAAPAPLLATAPLTYAAPHFAGYPYAGLPLAAAPVAAAPALPYAAPAAVVASAPAVRDAQLTTIKLNPGHAVAYRVD